MAGSTFIKDPQAILDYEFDLAAKTNHGKESDWLVAGEKIASYTVAVTPTNSDLTISNHYLANNNTTVVVWLSGGLAGSTYSVTCHFTTDSGPVARVDDRTMLIKVQER